MKGRNNLLLNFNQLKFSALGYRFLIAIKYLKIALDIAIGQNWSPDTDPEIYKFETMHEATACKLAYVIQQYGKAVFRVNQQQAFDLAGQATLFLRTSKFSLFF